MAEMEDEESQEEDVRGKGAKVRPQTQVLGEIEVPQASKERQRSSELGISNKYHRRLQTSVITKHLQVGQEIGSLEQARGEQEDQQNQDGQQ